MSGGKQGCLHVVGTDERDPASQNTMDADRRDRTAQQFPDPGIALHLRGRRQDTVHATLEQHVEVTLGVGTLPVDAPDQNPMALTTRLALGTDHETRELGVAQVAGHDAYSAGTPGNQTPARALGTYPRVLRGIEDTLPRLYRRPTPCR